MAFFAGPLAAHSGATVRDFHPLPFSLAATKIITAKTSEQIYVYHRAGNFVNEISPAISLAHSNPRMKDLWHTHKPTFVYEPAIPIQIPASYPAILLRRQRLRRADLRDRLVSDAATRHRLHSRVDGLPAGRLHERIVLGSLAMPRMSRYSRCIRLRSTPRSKPASVCWAFWCFSPFPTSIRPTLPESGPAFRTVLRGLLATICLLPPTFLMGASLPALSRWLEMDRPRSLLVGHALWRQHPGSCIRMPAGRLLPAAAIQPGHRDLRRRRHQLRRAALSFLMASRLPASSGS